MQGGYRNLGYILLVCPLIIVAGFWIPYFSQIPKFDSSITTAVHIHALLLFAWVGLLVIQPLTIRNRAFSIHRILGKASYVLMPLIVLFAIAMLGKEYREHLASGMTVVAARSAEYLSTIQVTLFAAFYGLAIARIQKRDIAEHMRYMICIALVLVPAGLARTLGYWFGVNQSASQTVCLGLIDLCLISLIVFDRRRQYAARPYVVALAAYVIVEAGWFALGRPV
jgi:phosphotransferase system  glucose/maltose/N-acetylglucosamine-specific IIC component